jgi:transposase-like protein
MPKRYTEAQRAEMAIRAYQLSLYGESHRSIARELGIDHKTVARLLDEEKERRREEQGDEALASAAIYQDVIKRCKQELDGHPSSHAVSQLSHAIVSARNSVDLLLGLRAPSKSQIQVQHSLEELVGPNFAKLNDDEIAIFSRLALKWDGAVPEDVPVLELDEAKVRQLETASLGVADWG